MNKSSVWEGERRNIHGNCMRRTSQLKNKNVNIFLLKKNSLPFHYHAFFRVSLMSQTFQINVDFFLFSFFLWHQQPASSVWWNDDKVMIVQWGVLSSRVEQIAATKSRYSQPRLECANFSSNKIVDEIAWNNLNIIIRAEIYIVQDIYRAHKRDTLQAQPQQKPIGVRRLRLDE